MTYESFMRRVKALIRRAGGNIKVRFSEDEEKGIHIAYLSEGIIITGNKTSYNVTVKWNGGNHQSVAAI